MGFWLRARLQSRHSPAFSALPCPLPPPLAPRSQSCWAARCSSTRRAAARRRRRGWSSRSRAAGSASATPTPTSTWSPPWVRWGGGGAAAAAAANRGPLRPAAAWLRRTSANPSSAAVTYRLCPALPPAPSPAGDECYIALDKGPITDQHVLVLPVEHYASTLQAPSSTTEEMARCVAGGGNERCLAVDSQPCSFLCPRPNSAAPSPPTPPQVPVGAAHLLCGRREGAGWL